MKFTFALPLLFLGSALASPSRSNNPVEDFLIIVEDLAKLEAHTNFARDIYRFMVYDKENAKTELNRFLDEFPKMEHLVKEAHDVARNQKNAFGGPRGNQVIYKMSDWTHSTFGLLFTMQENVDFVRENLPDQIEQIEPALTSYKKEFDNMMERYTDVMEKEQKENGRWIKRHRQRLDDEFRKTLESYEKGGDEDRYKNSWKFKLNTCKDLW